MRAVDVIVACGGDEVEQARHVAEYKETGTVRLGACSNLRSIQPPASHDGSAEGDDDQGFDAYAQINQSWAVPCVSPLTACAHA